MNKQDLEVLKKEIKLVYADDNMADFNKACKHRNLDYFCKTAITREEAIEILKEAIPNGSNYFKYKLLEGLPSDVKVHLARESSVCIYLEDNVNVQLMHVDEFNINKIKEGFRNLSRYWWD